MHLRRSVATQQMTACDPSLRVLVEKFRHLVQTITLQHHIVIQD